MKTEELLSTPSIYTKKIEEVSGIEIFKDMIGNLYLKHIDEDKFIDPKYYGSNIKDVHGPKYHGNPLFLCCRFVNEEGKNIYGVYFVEKRKWLEDLFSEVLTGSDDLCHLAVKLIPSGQWSVYNIETGEKVKKKFEVETDRFDNVTIYGHKLSASFKQNFSEIIKP